MYADPQIDRLTFEAAATITRLEEELDEAMDAQFTAHPENGVSVGWDEMAAIYRARASAAEAENARLRDALEGERDEAFARGVESGKAINSIAAFPISRQLQEQTARAEAAEAEVERLKSDVADLVRAGSDEATENARLREALTNMCAVIRKMNDEYERDEDGDYAALNGCIEELAEMADALTPHRRT